MDKLTSRENPTVKQAVRLRDDAKYRTQSGRFLIEGVRLCTDAAQSGVPVETVFVTERAIKQNSQLEELTRKADRSYLITEEIAEKLGDTKTPQGVFCVCRVEQNELVLVADGVYLALESVSDPRNLGAIIRTAEALGIDGLILSADCCDLYHPKTMRAAMGSSFRLPILQVLDLCAFCTRKKDSGFSVYGAVVDTTAMSVSDLTQRRGIIVAIGNEGRGLSDSFLHCCTPLTIPMKGRAESLNAAMAAGIIMWELLR